MSKIDKFKFNPPQGFTDSNAYPNPVDEENIREQLQRQHNQTRDYINRLIALLEEKGASVIVTSDGKTVEQALKDIAEAQGVSDYKDLSNKPSINGVELNGDASLDDLGLTDAIERSTTEALTEAKESGMFNGSDGYTPIKGEDYFTEEDKDEIVNETIEKIPLASFENYGLVKVDSRTAASDNYVTVTHARDAGRNEAYYVPTIKRFNNKPLKLNANFLPVATTDTIGAVKAGNNITIDEDGTINANALDVNLDDYAKKSEIPTKVSAFENDKGYLTEHQSLDEYAKKNEIPEVPTSLSQLTNDSGFITAKDIPEAGEKNVVTKVEPIGAGSPDRYKFTLNDGSSFKVPRLLGDSDLMNGTRLPLATQSSQGAMSKEDKTKLDGIENGANNYTHPTYQVLIETPIESKQLSFGSTFDVVNEIKDNNGHISEIGVERFKLPSIPSEYVTETELNAKGYLTQHQDLSAYAKKSELPTVPTKVSAFENDKGYLTEHQSLSAYSTTAQNDEKYQPKGDYLTSVPSEYVTETELTNKKYLTSIPSEYITESELTAKGYATQTSVDSLSEELDDLKNNGVDLTGYATEEYVDNEINEVKASMNQLQPLFMDSMEELEANGDTSKLYILPDNFIYAYKDVADTPDVPSGPSYTNQLAIATDEDGSIYNGVGYLNGYRLNSSGNVVEYGTYPSSVTGFIPIKQGDVVRFKNAVLQKASTQSGSCNSVFYDADKNQLLKTTVYADTNWDAVFNVDTQFDENNIMTQFTVATTRSEHVDKFPKIAYMRLTLTDVCTEDSVITVNEEIVENSGGNSGYTNLFDTSGSGFKDETTKFYTNWLPYNQLDNGGTGTIYHFKGLVNSDPTYQNPYKMQFATDSNGTSASAQSYCANANVQKTTTASYDDTVMIVQHNTGNTTYKYVQFEIREALPSDLIITANENIIGEPAKPNDGYTNLADTSSADWGEDTRMKDSGELSVVQGRRTSNFIPASKGDAIHVKGINVLETTYPASAVAVYDSSKTWLGGFSVSASTNANIVGVSSYDENVIVVNPSVYLTDTKYDNMAYVRLCGGTVGDKNDCVITVNEKIIESENTGTSQQWTNTGHAFIPTEYDSQIATLTNKTNILTNSTNKNASDIKSLQESVKDLESGKTTTSLPDYWEEYLPSKIATIQALQESGGKDCFSFPLLTDIHITVNLGKRSGIIAKRIMDECNMKYAVCCGDVITRGANKTKEQTEQNYASVEELLAPIRPQLLQTQGNHDGSWGQVDLDGDGDVEGEEYYCFNYTPQLNYERIYRKVGLVGDVHFDKSGSGYWIDDVSNKVRYIGMNSHCNKYEENADGTAVYNNMRVFRLTQSQFDMTIEALTTIPNDEWAVLSFSHAPLNNRDGSLFADRIVMRDMLNAYKNKTSYKGTYGTSGNYDYVTVDVNFSSAKGEYIAHFSGHTHTDTVTTDFGIPIITTRCDGKEENDATLNAEKVLGTVTEQSFDIFTVNKAERKIYATKIGAGDDREIEF